MKITIKLDEEQERRLEQLAKKLGVTKQTILQEGVNLFEDIVREFVIQKKSVEEVRAKIKKRIARFTGEAG